MTKVKICGITNLEDARLAVGSGADAIGLNFYKNSPRYLSSTAASEIARHVEGSVSKIGVFVNQTTDEILEIVEDVGLDGIQLHGDETPELIGNLRARCELPVIKALRVSPDFDIGAVREYNLAGILLDGYSTNARGGTGETFDWAVARAVSELVAEIWLAGGLTPDNVRTAIEEVRPFAVDACSSLESSPGLKDARKVERFIKEAKFE
ncbi:MAG TPA: phosphoribosylanthranilate isomerase [Pyrinomonadaceae bacterium]|nr:phosphoribosylanthranilate isomerase [Pyrinomonadaceae bacterium]